MDCSDKVQNKGLVEIKRLKTEEADLGINPIHWNWLHVQEFLQLNEPWTWLLVPCQGMTGLDILLLTPARVCELCKPFETKKLEEFIGFVNYLRISHWGFAIQNGSETKMEQIHQNFEFTL